MEGSDAFGEEAWKAVRREHAQYRSKFRNWDARATVRVRPERRLEQGDKLGLMFPPELCPVATHPLVVKNATTESLDHLLVHRLYQYMHFTTVLESVAVIPVTTSLSLGSAGLRLPDEMREDAFKITTDEAWHAQFSYGLIRQVARETGIAADLPISLPFTERLARLRDSIESGLRKLCDLIFAVVSETLISSLLSDIPKDTRVRGGVRDLVADHAEDEGRHHAYFKSLLEILWPTLSPTETRTFGPLLPEMVKIFLEPDLRSTAAALLRLDISADEVEQIIVESYPAEQTRSEIATMARSTTRYFMEMGAMNDQRTAAAFAAAELLGKHQGDE